MTSDRREHSCQPPAAAAAFSSWSRSMRRTVAGEGCWPFFVPRVMTRRAAMSRRLLAAQVERHGEHGLVGDGGTADGLAAGAGRLVSLQGAVADVLAFHP
jgi:hypothetical protein